MAQPDAQIDVPDTWRAAAEGVLTKGWRRLLVLGATDCGKSTFCRFLLRQLAEAGKPAALVDADTGQKDVGPPATVTLARAGRPLTAQNAAELYFVGDTSPVGLFLPLVVGTRRLLEAAGQGPVVINTTGLIHGPGRALKDGQIASLRPDALYALQRSGELEPILREHRRYPVVPLEVSPRARRKSVEARRAAREAAFGAYFSVAKTVVLDARRVVVQRAPLFVGRPVVDDRFVYAEATPDGLVGVSADTSVKSSRRLRILPEGFESGLLCGIVGGGDKCLGLGIVAGIDFGRMHITVHTPIPAKRIRALQFGRLYLAPDGRELGVWRPPR